MTLIGSLAKRHLMGSMIALLTFAGLVSMNRPALAQLDTQTAIVLDFEVTPGYDPVLGRKAADALAVELQRENQFETVSKQKLQIVPRQRLGQIIDENAGLIAPYTSVVQSRLGQIAGASRIYSGRIMSVLVSDHRLARVTLEVRVLDVPTGTYFNGSVVSQEAVSIDESMDNDLLIDQAINKAVYDALMDIKSKPLTLGTVQNVTVRDMYLNIGTRDGVLKGQRYAVIRPLYLGRDSESKDVVRSTRVAEVIIASSEMDQSIAMVISGGAGGVKTGDKVHLIYVPAIMPQKNPDLSRTNPKYLTPDQVEALSAIQDSRRRQIQSDKTEQDLRMAEKRIRQYQKQAQQNQ
ncbi:MAG: hypothetical protein ABI210_03220 [Abditibacteriaceae bacterium]